MPGSTFSGSPPRRATASRIAARSAMAGTPVRSCIRTRAGMNCSSRLPTSCAARLRSARARMSSAVTSTPSSRRSRFSTQNAQRIRQDVRGRRRSSRAGRCRSESSPTERRDRAPKLSRVTICEATLRLCGRRHCGRRRRHQARGRRGARRRHPDFPSRARRRRLDARRRRALRNADRPRRPARCVERSWRSASGCGGPMDAGGEHVSPLNIPAWRDVPAAGPPGRAHRAADVRRQRRQGARARRRLDRRGARRARTTSGWSCRPASAAASCSTAGSSTATPGNAGHIGHVIVEPDGHECGCGARGCLEAEASGHRDRAHHRRARRPTRRSDVRERTGMLVGRAVASVANLLDLPLAVVSGSVALGFGEPFFAAAQARARRALPPRLLPRHEDRPRRARRRRPPDRRRQSRLQRTGVT